MKTEKDKQDYNWARLAIFSLMRDGKWYRAETIISRSGQREGLRRMRELRKRDDVEEIQVRRDSSTNRSFSYRMILSEGVGQ
jgi:hypothetical protein